MPMPIDQLTDTHPFVYVSNPKTSQLPRLVNQLSYLVGDDIVIKGLDVTYEFNEVDQYFKVSVNPGLFIEDLTLIEMTSPQTISLDDLTQYDVDGHFIVYLSYRYLERSKQQTLLGIKYVNQQGQVLDGWDKNVDRLVLNFYKFTRDPETNRITSIVEGATPSINIFNQEYYKYGYHPDNISLSRYIDTLTTINNSNSQVPSFDDPMILTNSFVSHGPYSIFDNSVTANNEMLVRGNFEVKGDQLLSDAGETKFGSTFLEINKNELGAGITTTGTDFKAGLVVNRGLLPPAKLYYDDVVKLWYCQVGNEVPIRLGSGEGSSTVGPIYHSDILDWLAAFNASFNSKTTTDLSEGGNKYFTEQRSFDSILSYLRPGSYIEINNINDRLVISCNIQPITIEERNKLSVLHPHPPTHPATIIDQDSEHRFVTDSNIELWNAIHGGSYSSIYYGSTIPDSNLGSDDSFYFRTDGRIYHKELATDSWSLIITYGTSDPFPLTPATATNLGGVKIGFGLNVAEDGLVSVTNALYTPPSAYGPTITSQEDVLNFIMTQPLSITQYKSSFSSEVTILGVIIPEIDLSWIYSKPVINQSLKILKNNNSITLQISDRSFAFTDVSETTTYTLSATGGNPDIIVTDDITIEFANYFYYGSYSGETTVDIHHTLTERILSNELTQSFKIVVEPGDYFWICVPSRLGNSRTFVNGIDGGVEFVEEMIIMNEFNYSELYKIYKSTNTSLGLLTIDTLITPTI